MIPGAASANDLVFWDAACVQSATWHEARDGMFRMFTHYRLQTIVLPAGSNDPGIRVEKSTSEEEEGAHGRHPSVDADVHVTVSAHSA